MDDQRLQTTPPTSDAQRPGPDQPGTDQPDPEDLRRMGNEGGPIGLRVGRDPANLGDDVPEESDLTLPDAMPEPAQM